MNKQHTIEEIANVRKLSREELAAVTGGAPFRNSFGANFYNSDAFRNGVVQFAGAAGGLLATGVAIVTAPISFPLAVGAAAVAGTIAAFVAADAQMDMQNAHPDPDPEAAAVASANAGAAAAHRHHNEQVAAAGHAGAQVPHPTTSGYGDGGHMSSGGGLPYR
jgi:hypothetical protein